ncbi:MAG TPA: transketolase C-terminal domain-containing protein [Acidimicrobiales bacterium]|jgi:transketolase|nr:transketolase C-terminal domain-containing protein [Acidimicrobiales bacterium]
MRNEFAAAINRLAQQDPSFILLTADLGYGVLTDFAHNFPNQFVNVGVAEQNMIGIAAGLAMSGRTVFTYSIANFATLRCLEQIRNDICYPELSVTVVAVGGGYSYGSAGYSHHATEDLAIMRAMPNMTVLAPGDGWEATEATMAAAKLGRPCYLRLDRSAGGVAPDGDDEGFRIGRLRRIHGGPTVVLVASGGILGAALQAKIILDQSGIEVGVVSCHTVKPLDRRGIVEIATSSSLLVTIEEHSVIGGLGSAVAELVVDEFIPVRLLRLALPDGFPSVVGSQDFLRNRYGLSPEHIADQISARLAVTG